MPHHLPRPQLLAALAVALPAVMLLSACVTPSSPPAQVGASNPTVTYVYRGDDELIKAYQ
jgi:hypothetical protein